MLKNLIKSFITATILLNLLPQAILANNDILKVELLTTTQKKYICVNSDSIIKNSHMPLNKVDNWCIKSKKDFLSLYQNNNNNEHHLPKKITITGNENNPVCISNSTIKKRCYKGDIEISTDTNNLNLINTVNMVDYLYSTTGSELPHKWPEEAVKAQAIAIQSYTLNKIEHNKHIKDSTQDIFYGGTLYEKPDYNKYIDKVKNIIMVDKNNKPIEALFHSTCAGGTLNNDIVFKGKPEKYLRSVKCNYCSDSNFYKDHIVKIQKNKLLTDLHTNNLQIIHNDTGKIEKIIIDNNTFTPYEFWLKLGHCLGWGTAPGIKYNITLSNNLYQITSKGAGHAVGLCQWGSRKMATMGYKYTDILRFYYKNILFFDINTKKQN
ncbi:MAG: SpoIID/LytB domain-containing protein [Vampirovibrionia bacterium]